MRQRLGAAATLKIGKFALIRNHKIQRDLSKKMQQQKMGPYEILDIPTDVTYILRHHETSEEITSHRNNMISFTPKEFYLARLVEKY